MSYDGERIAKALNGWIAKEGKESADPTTIKPIKEHRKYLEHRLRVAFISGANEGIRIAEDRILARLSNFLKDAP